MSINLAELRRRPDVAFYPDAILSDRFNRNGSPVVAKRVVDKSNNRVYLIDEENKLYREGDLDHAPGALGEWKPL